MMKQAFTILACLLSNTLYANQDFYATIGVGLTIPSRNSATKDNSSYVIYGPTTAPSGESIFNLPNVDWHNKYNNGLNFNTSLGYSFTSNWRSDIEFLFQIFKRNLSGTYDWKEYDALTTDVIDSKSGINMTKTSNNTNIYSLLTNGYYDFAAFSKWTPSIGAGFGIAWLKSGGTTAYGSFTTPLGVNATTLQHSPGLSGTAFAWQIKVGASYKWKESKDIIFQYRLFATSNFISKTSNIITNPNSGSSTRTFYIGQHSIAGLITNSIEIALRLKL